MSRKIHVHLFSNGLIVEERESILMDFGLTEEEFLRKNHKDRTRFLKRLKDLGYEKEAERLKQITNHLNRFHNGK